MSSPEHTNEQGSQAAQRLLRNTRTISRLTGLDDDEKRELRRRAIQVFDKQLGQELSEMPITRTTPSCAVERLTTNTRLINALVGLDDDEKRKLRGNAIRAFGKQLYQEP